MTNTDHRRLSPDAQEVLRRNVIAALRGGMRKSVAARTFGVSRTSIDTWLAKVDDGGLRALKSGRRGRPKESRLAGHQAATIVRLIIDRTPDQLKLPFALWTREAVRDLIQQRCGLTISVRTAGRYLKRWNLTPQKPMRRAYEQDPEAVRRWKQKEYPEIRRRAKRENAEIHWGDQMGVRSDHQTGTSYGRRGETPVIPGTGKRFGCNMMSSLTNRGALSFMMFKERFTADVFLRFCRKLLRQRRRKVFLILDRHPVHLSAKARDWLDANAHRIRMFLMPGYSPELNPDEYLNNDVKSNAVGRKRAKNQQELILNVTDYLQETQRWPTLVKRYFLAKDVQYAAS